MQIVMYCARCGEGLREWDFQRGRARLVENRPYCRPCMPVYGDPRVPPLDEPMPGGARRLPVNRPVV